MNNEKENSMNEQETKTGQEACPLDAIVNPPCNEVFLMDCMEGMKQYPDKFFDIAIVDPPYGIGQNQNAGKSIGLRKKWDSYETQKYKPKEWDSEVPDKKYFDELKRVSKNQIIWGGNYFNLNPTRGIISWDKVCDKTSFSDFELAWSSFDKAAKIFRLPIQAESQRRIHPTQKPVKLYEWLIMNYAEDCETILDTHVGSGSSRIAAHKAGKSFVGFEIDEDYWNAQEKRFKEFKKQLTLF